MTGALEQLAAAGALSVALLAVGVPLAVRVVPSEQARWWPLLAPGAGLAAWLVATGFVGHFASADKARVLWILFPLAGIALTVVWRRFLVRPHGAALATLAVAVVAGVLVLVPSLSAGVPVPPGIVSADGFFYASNAQWLTGHDSKAVPPDPRADSFFTPAFAAHKNPLRIGAESVDSAIASAAGVSPIYMLPGLTAFLAATAVCSLALLALALGAAEWAVVAVAVLVALRPEAVRLPLDSAVAQAVGNALLPLLLAAAVAWLRVGRRLDLAAGVVVAAAMVAGYPEYGPFAVGALGVALAVLLIAPAWAAVEGGRKEVALRAAALAGGTLVLALPVVARSFRSLEAIAKLPDFNHTPFPTVRQSIEWTFGGGDQYHAQSLIIAAVVALLVIVGIAVCRGAARALAVGIVVASVAVYLQVRVGSEFGQGVRKALGLAGPLLIAFAGVGLTWLYRRRSARVVAAVALAAFVVTATIAVVDLERRALDSPYAPYKDDIKLADADSLGTGTVALEGVERQGVPMGRVHWSVYALRVLAGHPVGYEIPISYMLSASYENPKVYVPQNGDEAYRHDYQRVVSLGPSVSHSDRLQRVGRYVIYKRAGNADVIASSSHWIAPGDSGHPAPLMLDAQGEGPLIVSALKPARVRLIVATRSDAPRVIALHRGEQLLVRKRVGAGESKTATVSFDVPAGRTDVGLTTTPTPGAATSGLGLVSVRVEQDPK